VKEARWRRWLEEDQEVRLWYENMERGSPVTADETIRVLYRYLSRHNLTPRELVEMARKDLRSLENQFLGFIKIMEKEGKAPNYIQAHMKAVKSYLNHHNIPLTRRFNIKNQGATPTLEDERVPTKEELKAIFSSATLRGRVIASLMAFAGVRPEVLGNMRGTDGLTLKDLPDLKIEGKEVRFGNVPAMVIVRAALSKAGHRYFSFLPQEGCDYLKAYLEQRLAGGEILEPGSAVIRVAPGSEAKLRSGGLDHSPFIVSRNVSRDVREAMRPRYTWRPYVLRAYCDTQLLIAESNGKISHAYRAFFMGHKGDIEARYTTNKGRLTPQMIEDLRKKYEAAAPYLETHAGKSADDQMARTVKVLLAATGIPSEQVERLDLAGKNDEEVAAAVQSLLKAPRPQTPPPPSESKSRSTKQRIIGMDSLDSALADGWIFKAALPDGRAIIETLPGYA
jgi:hypothetical protein